MKRLAPKRLAREKLSKKLSKAAQRRVLQNIDVAQQEANLAVRQQFRATEDELMASAYYGLCLAARSPYRGRRFRIYARVWCRWRIILDQKWLHGGSIDPCYLQLIGTEEPIATEPDALLELIASENHAWLVSAIDSLQGRRLQVISRILDGAMVKEVAAEMQLHSSTISYYLACGVKQLQTYALSHPRDIAQD